MPIRRVVLLSLAGAGVLVLALSAGYFNVRGADGIAALETPTEEAASTPRLFRDSQPDGRLEQFLVLLSAGHGVTITPLGGIESEWVTVYNRDGDLESILTEIARPKGWIWWRNQDGSYGIGTEEWYLGNLACGGMATIKVLRPQHLLASDLAAAIRPLLTPGTSRITADPRTNKVFIVDSYPVIEWVTDLAGELDRPGSSLGALP